MLATLTVVHVAISLAGILSGFVVIQGLLTAKRLERWTQFFLATTILTSVTGFLFPIHGLTPGLVLGIVSLVLLTLAVAARYSRHLAGNWSRVYAVSAVTAQYLNVLVLIVQSFQKIPVLHALAPTQSEPAFVVTQVAALAVFVALGVLTGVRFKTQSLAAG
jgi:hypothetical protein